MKRVIITLCLCMMFLADVMAQEIISGTVVDGKNNPLPGVRVEIVGRTEVVYTDIDGIFKFDIPVKADKVRISYVGYKPQERKIKPDMVIKIGNGWAGKPSGFRGFFDIYGGFGIGGKVNVNAGKLAINDIQSFLNFGFTYSLGWQINKNLYVGAGFGATAQMLRYDEEGIESYYDSYTNSKFYQIQIPIFADVRWDFGLGERKTAPFVDLKLGYQIGVSIDDDYQDAYYPGYYNELELYMHKTNGMFIQPAIGMRTATGNKTGINFGLAYNFMMPKKLTAGYHYDNGSDYMDLGKSNSGVLMLNIGFDF